MRHVTRNTSSKVGGALAAAGLCVTLGWPRPAAAQISPEKSNELLRGAVHRLSEPAAQPALADADTPAAAVLADGNDGDAAPNAATPSAAAAPTAAELERRIEQLESELEMLKANAQSMKTMFLPEGQQAAAPAAPAGPDLQTPFAYGDFTWLNGTPRNKKVAFDTPFFTPEVRFDTHYMYSFNHPADHTLVGSTESFRTGEFQVEQISVGGDFHLDNVRGRVLYMMGLFATTTPRNDASTGVGQWDVADAYRYTSEAYGGYHFDVQHGINVDAGIFVSYIGLFSYYNFDNWTYQPSYVSSNTPWFFNGLRVQWFPTNKLKIEPWLINGWQSYNRPNGRMGFGGQVLWQPYEWFKLVLNNYTNGADAVGIPQRHRAHTDDSIEIRYYNNPESDGISKMAFSFTADYGCEFGGGVVCHGGNAQTPSQYFAGWMVYNRIWFKKDTWAITPGGGMMTNPGRYLTLLPPINGATAFTGTPYFTENPGDQANQWDLTLNVQYMPKDFITFWGEVGYRHSDVPYFAGPGGVTPPGGNNGVPNQYACMSGAPSGATDLPTAQLACGGANQVWFPDLRKDQTVISTGIMVKF
ncbi:MAG TPA: outer membrane beta-barrel protein [Vicinamibacterales bacterium]|nr:outer membrane beta-barrel protein [Vicinamibacterales bacterium]